MRYYLALLSLLVCTKLAMAEGVDRPVGKYCDLVAPPAKAGETTIHGHIIRIYPRKYTIDHSFSGCQVMFAPVGEKWRVFSMTEVVKGDPVRLWSDDLDAAASNACRYKKGKAISGEVENCPMPAFLLQESVAPGCSHRVQEAISKGGLRTSLPQGCEFR